MKIRSRLRLVALVPVTAMVLSVALSRWQPSAALGLAALGAVASIVMATKVATSIVTPLSRLGAASERGAQLSFLVEALRRPGARDDSMALTPLGLESDDELGRAAQSFDAFQGSAAKLAVQQAALLNKSVADKGTFEVFVNLARRMQGLVDHQIEFLDGLEASEQDPDTLDNLFKLDQLATRVRRNAESLLAMAGTTSGRSWERPLAMSDVIRAGIAEVEDLGRIDLVVHDDATMVGNVAADAAHLLSELLENATRWSPPDTRVEVSGEPKLGGYKIEVRDRGIGMDAESLAEANHILTGPALAGATVARSLGLVVAGRLAKRMGITVHLAAGSPGGITAIVLVPPSLMVTGEAAEAVEATGARTLPFALARQEKRARISSQRRRQRGQTPPAPVADGPAPTIDWYDGGPGPSVRTESARIIRLPESRPPASTPSSEEPAPRRSVWDEPDVVTADDTPAEDVEVPAAGAASYDDPLFADTPVDDTPFEDVPVDDPPFEDASLEDTAFVDLPVRASVMEDTPAPEVAEVASAAEPSSPDDTGPAGGGGEGGDSPAPGGRAPLAARFAARRPVDAAASTDDPWAAASMPSPRPGPSPATTAPPARSGLPVRRIPSGGSIPIPDAPAPAALPAPPAEEPAAAVGPSAEAKPESTSPTAPLRPVPVVRPVRFAASGDRNQAGPEAPARGTGGARAAAEDNYQRHLERATANGLVRRVPKASLPAENGRASAPAPTNTPPSVADRLPDEVRSLLSSYRSGVQRGRQTGMDDQSPNTQERS